MRVLTESAGLAARGHDVTLACPPGAAIVTHAAPFGLPVKTLPIDRKRFSGLWAVRSLLRDGGWDVVNTHSSIDSWLVALARVTLRRPPPMVRTRHVSAPLLRNLPTRWLYTRAPARVVTNGRALRQALIDDYGFDGRRIVAVPDGIDVDVYCPGDRMAARDALGLPRQRTILGIVAGLRRSKGHHLLLQAIARLRVRDPLLVIVGDGPRREELRQQTEQLHLGDSVRLVGAQDDLLPWLRAFDVFVLPALHEGLPHSLAQAMACGCCCVTTHVGGIPEIATDGESACFVPPDDVDALVAALERVLDDAALRERLAEGARRAAIERCSIERMLDRMEALLGEVVTEARVR